MCSGDIDCDTPSCNSLNISSLLLTKIFAVMIIMRLSTLINLKVLHKLCQNTGFLWLVFSLILTYFMQWNKKHGSMFSYWYSVRHFSATSPLQWYTRHVTESSRLQLLAMQTILLSRSYKNKSQTTEMRNYLCSN